MNIRMYDLHEIDEILKQIEEKATSEPVDSSDSDECMFLDGWNGGIQYTLRKIREALHEL